MQPTPFNTATRRLMAEYQAITRNPTQGIITKPLNDDNMFVWTAIISGPKDTCFENGVFRAVLTFPQNYPLRPPKMRFLNKIFHPNVYPDGRVCISILHTPEEDPTGYDAGFAGWSPMQSIETVLVSVVSMLAEPNVESPANVDAAKMWRENREEFNRIAQQNLKS